MIPSGFEVRPVTKWTVKVPGLKKTAKERKQFFFSEEDVAKALPRIASQFHLKVEDLDVKKAEVFGIYFEGVRLNCDDGFFGDRKGAESRLDPSSWDWKHWNELAEMVRKTNAAKAGK